MCVCACLCLCKCRFMYDGIFRLILGLCVFFSLCFGEYSAYPLVLCWPVSVDEKKRRRWIFHVLIEEQSNAKV